ncbi:putative bifunctional diguanylate cyclase/phosphodiesterase [Aurantimonas sp. NFXS3]|uniref:putative bifunctional diguanylate cyclase/phosphodiesterase n=1 Tax=Aurantimonas sp. NFXS3 TaxID=2818434 RepID=UPI003B8ACCCD
MFDASSAKPAREEPQGHAADRLRGVQLTSILKTTPVMMFGNVMNAIIILGMSSGEAFSPWALIWLLGLSYIVLVSIRAWSRFQRRAPLVSASSRATAHAVRNAFILGAWWGLAILTFYPSSDGDAKSVIAVIAMGMICGGGFALSALKRALQAFIIPLFVGSAAALGISQGTNDYFLLALLLGFTFIVYRASCARGELLQENFEGHQKLAEQSSIIELLLREFEEGTSDWIWQTDHDGQLVRGGDRFSQIFGRGTDSLISNSDQTFAGQGLDLSPVAQPMLERTPFREAIIEVPGQQGSAWIAMTGKPIFGHDGAFTGYRGVASDITATTHAERRIAYLAHHDSLTGLANRSRFAEEIDRICASPPPHGPTSSLLYLDLDNFKLINDRNGHLTGDQLLRQVAARLLRIVEPGDMVARIGGDEFAIVAHSAPDTASADRLAAAILACFATPFSLGAELANVGCSVGIAFPGLDGANPDDLLRNADLALYEAKAAGKNTFCFFESEMAQRLRDRHRLEYDLRCAVERNELVLNYQPIVDSRTRQTLGFEALVRWEHPLHGRVQPDHFIPLAEQTGAICGIGAWVLREACRNAVAWGDRLTVAVNVSVDQFRHGTIKADVEDALASSGLAAHRLELEITESLFIDDPETVVAVLHGLRALGVRIALDDFGTGYSSLSYLRKFPFDKLKIDRSFVNAIKDDRIAHGILETILALGRVLNLSVTAEGVENAEQIDILTRMTCNQFQGYYFSRPMEAADLGAYLLRDFCATAEASRASSAALATA